MMNANNANLPTTNGSKSVYSSPKIDGLLFVERRSDGTLYGMADSFDFSADTDAEMIEKLNRMGAHFAGVE